MLVSLGITFSLAILFLLFSQSKSYQLLEFKALDLRFVLRGNRAPEAPVLHIDIDDQSLSKLGRWPWPRSYHARLTDILYECGASKVLMDVLFTEELKDKPEDDALYAVAMGRSNIVYLPFYFTEGKTPPSPELRNLLLKDITISVDDAAEALGVDKSSLEEKLPLARRYLMDEVMREVLADKADISVEEILSAIEERRGWFLFPAEESYIRENFAAQKLVRYFVNKFSINYKVDKSVHIQTYEDLNPPIKAYADTIRDSGYINADPDLDGVMRSVPLFLAYGDKIFPQMSFNALLDFLKVSDVEIKHKSVVLKGAHIKDTVRDIVIPVDNKCCMMVNWAGRWTTTFEHLPFYLVIRLQEVREQLQGQLNKISSGTDEPSQKDAALLEYIRNDEKMLKEKLTKIVKGKICIVGLTATGTQDMGPIPFQTNYPMVGTHTNLINTIYTEKFITRVPRALNMVVFFLTAIFVSIISLARLWKSLLLFIGYAAGYFLITLLAFSQFGLWIDLVGPQGILVFGFSGITAFRYFTEEKEKLWIKNAFGHYLAPQVINELMADPDKLKLGGERRQITVLFSDVRGFTTFSESHQPEEVVGMLNEVLTEQVKVVFKYYGTLDKFVGDELMAFFGAPGNAHAQDHAIVAVQTAIDIQNRMKELQAKWSAEGKEALNIGIGVNTGDMVVGNMGSAERMDYTVIGDNVNLGARLCSAAGKGEIIISEATYEQAKDHIEVEKLEPITVKGKSKPISIYRVLGKKQA